MRFNFALIPSFVVIYGTALGSGAEFTQKPELARVGRGLLPPPAESPATLGGTPMTHPFLADKSGGFSRTIFETDQDRDLRIVIRDFGFPPDKQVHTIIVPSTALFDVLSGEGEVRIAKKRAYWKASTRITVQAGTRIEIINHGDSMLVARALIVEAK